MIKPFVLAILLTCSATGVIKDGILALRFENEPLRASKVLQQFLSSNGYQGEIQRFSFDGTISEIQIRIKGKKGYDPKRFMEELKERSIRIRSSHTHNQQWYLNLDMGEAILDIPSINEDSSSQMNRSIYPYWFDVSGARYITIEAPYGGAWYPEIAVMDTDLRVLHSSKQIQSQHRMVFELPDGSHYLKVSNAQGMHLLKEGMWVSSELSEN